MNLLAGIAALVVSLCSVAQTHVNVSDARAGYVLGPGDQFSMEIADLEELNGKIHRIDNDGTVTLPLVGRIKAAGYTLPDFEKVLDDKLASQLKEPHITITVTEAQSHDVTVIGEVNAPGVHQIRGQESLAEVLSRAGGLRPDAGYRVTVTRPLSAGTLPVQGARVDEQNHVSIAEVNVSEILEGSNLSNNIYIVPHDVITVPRAKLVYVIGEVRKSGGFTLQQQNRMSIIQAIALAEGTTRTASKSHALILRQEPGAPQRSQIQVDIDKVMKGKTPDVTLQANDILYVPNSLTKTVRIQAIETAVSTGAGVLIWRGL